MTTIPILSQSSSSGVLIASPSTFLHEQVVHSFGDTGRTVHEARGGAEALFQLENGDWQVLFLDRRLPDLDAEELIGIIKQRFPGIEVVLLDSDSGQSLPLIHNSAGLGEADDQSPIARTYDRNRTPLFAYRILSPRQHAG